MCTRLESQRKTFYFLTYLLIAVSLCQTYYKRPIIAMLTPVAKTCMEVLTARAIRDTMELELSV